jgi:nicotinic acid mononucleotide adenylyltransferase
MHWKIRRDPYLARLCERKGESAVWAAGFFFDNDPENAPLDDVDWLCTPRPKRNVTGDRPAVILSTGAFCPIHAGHLAAMEEARAAAERAGYDIVGGYLSPGHDEYIRKKCGPAAIPAQERLLLCAAAAASSTWLSVDPWESMHRRVAVNYTDVAARLQAYLRKHFDPRTELLFMCGADNARFALAFTELGGCVVVNRPGAEPEFAHWKERLGGHPNILWVDGPRHSASSRTLRNPVWHPPKGRRLVVRLEDSRAVQTLGLQSFDAFQKELLELLSCHAPVRGVRMRGLEAESNVISLDPMIPASHNLAISRLFALGGYEPLGHVPRPGAAPLRVQLAAIRPGEYVLRDDDCMTNSTLNAVRSLLLPTVTIRETRFAIEPSEDEDVLDARDFLLGADHAGLVVALPSGGIGRAPYLLPYVDPSVRASVLASHEFSIRVWLLNSRIFARTDLRVRHLPASSQATLRTDPERRLDEVCLWHADRLRGLHCAAPTPA